MTDILSIATYAACQSMNFDLLDSVEVHYAIAGDDAWLVSLHNVTYRQESNVSRTATIIAEMRAENAAENAAHAARLASDDWKPRHSGERTTARLTATQDAAKHILLKGLEGDRNNYKRDCSLPARAMSMCASRGRVQPDMLEALLSFFASPGALAESLLNSFLPERPAYGPLVEYLGELGIEATAKDITALKLFGGNRAPGHGAPRRVSVFTPGVVIAAEAPKGRGRPSGPKYVSYLCTAEVANAGALLLAGDRTPYGCEDIAGMAGGNDVAHGAGHEQGSGWDTARALTPAQVQRRNIALDSSSHGFRTNAEGEVIEIW